MICVSNKYKIAIVIKKAQTLYNRNRAVWFYYTLSGFMLLDDATLDGILHQASATANKS